MKILLANWELKALAILAAIIFWFLVVATENTFYTFPEEVPIKAFNVPEDLVVSEDLGTVKLRLRIDNRDIIGNLLVDDFSAFVDLEGMEAGEREIEVEVSSKKSEINIAKVEPSKILVKIAEKAEKEVELNYELIGDVAEGYFVKEVILPIETTMIKGSDKSLENIELATLLIALDGQEHDFTNSFDIVVLDENAEPFESVIAIESEIEAQVIIAAESEQKVAGVQPSIIGSPQENVWIKSINVEPNFVILTGNMTQLNEVEFVKTSDIDVSGISQNISYDVAIVGLPQGVEIDGGNTVKVSIEVETYVSVDSAAPRQTVKVPVLIRKFNTDQKSIKPDPFTVTLVVEGSKDLSKVELKLDITGYEGDSAQIELTESNFNLPDGIKVISILPSKINVTWK